MDAGRIRDVTLACNRVHLLANKRTSKRNLDFDPPTTLKLLIPDSLGTWLPANVLNSGFKSEGLRLTLLLRSIA